ncbi:hypothetical protein FQN57_003646 [Myotisia sp. PD_48]|nr:hypothetical protein FQN57_003646 [Myotisia sp. PD_48]
MQLRARPSFIALGFSLLALLFWMRGKYAQVIQFNSAHFHDGRRFSNATALPARSTTVFEEHAPVATPTPDNPCSSRPFIPPALPYSEWLLRKNYTRVYLQPNFMAPETNFEALEVIKQSFLPEFGFVHQGKDLSSRGDGDAQTPFKCPPLVDIKVAADGMVEHTDNILVGLATTMERLHDMLSSLIFSYGHTKASLLVLVPDDTKDIEVQEAFFHDHGLDITIKTSSLPFTARYFGLVKAFRAHIKKQRPGTRWVIFVDDDTFFPSLATIGNRLAKLDSSKRHYIGSPSESTQQVKVFGRFAFGGAGVIISKPLLEVLHGSYQECQDFKDHHGDQKLAHCVSTFGETNLTNWDTLYQIDMTGDMDGIFESGRRFDSLHHWRSWYHTDVVKMSAVAAAAGRGSVLRRWRFDEKVTEKNKRVFWVLTNGYSIVRYTLRANLPAEAVGFEYVEKTFRDDAEMFEDRLGPFRPKKQAGVKKERWMLSDSTMVANNVHQLYTMKEGDHSTIELVWLGRTSN